VETELVRAQVVDLDREDARGIVVKSKVSEKVSVRAAAGAAASTRRARTAARANAER
jgi:hypothetical protein